MSFDVFRVIDALGCLCFLLLSVGLFLFDEGVDEGFDVLGSFGEFSGAFLGDAGTFAELLAHLAFSCDKQLDFLFFVIEGFLQGL